MTASPNGPAAARRASDNAAAPACAAASGAPVRFELPRPHLIPLELRDPTAGQLPERHHLAESVAVLALQLPQRPSPAPDLVEATGVVRDPLRRQPQLAFHLADLGLGAPEPFDQLPERCPVLEGADGLPQGLQPWPLERPVRDTERVAVRRGVGEQRLLGLQGHVLPRIVHPGGVDLLDLEPQQVELPGPGPLVTPQPGELLTEPAALGPRRPQRGERHRGPVPREPIQRVALGRRREQPLVRMLGVQLGELTTHARQLPHGRQPTVEVRPGPPVSRQHPRQDVLDTVLVLEPALHPSLRRAPPHQRRVGAAPEQQIQRLHQQRLARTGLTGDRGQSRAEQQREVIDDPEIAHVQLSKRRRHRSANPNFAFNS